MKHHVNNISHKTNLEDETDNRVTKSQLSEFWHKMDIRFRLTKERVRQVRAKQNASGQYNN